ncbi:DUF4365 domain-containing protein [Paenibacillus donghaensis]|uniref:DUF4365 domain-containing protein n=1 Tax=Paenibacillus donghaensis TaxID=414771 RepID=A0A2Z2KLK9_9BACL|nr:DUF4365 and DUF1817 domain-containing protein [Paenibacillus donghaensis]ASA23369.1 hypothetical protein B9T62_22715 [Paenibacillus donghaensis]
MSFPKRNKNQLKGTVGQTFFQHYVNAELNCIYHPINQENDFGIDGYIELVENDNVSGKLIGIQLKHGDSFFRSKTSGGYKFVGETKHLNYYLNSQSPVYIVIMDGDFQRMNWVMFEIDKTSPNSGDGWWIEVPEDNLLISNFQDELFQTVGPIINYEDQIKYNWAIDATLQGASFRVVAIPKKEILTGSFDYIINFIERLSKNKDILIKSRSTLDIFFPAYDEDDREIFQIPEIMDWLKKSVEVGIPWFYFLDTREMNTGLTLLMHSYCRKIKTVKSDEGYLAEFDRHDLKKIIEKNYINLNIYTEENKLSLEINKEISLGIFEYLKTYLQES